MRTVICRLTGFLLLWTGPNINAAFAKSKETNSFSVGVQTQYLDGNTTYHISDYVGSSGIESELEFPLKPFSPASPWRTVWRIPRERAVFMLSCL